MRKLSILLLLPMILIGSTSRWELNYRTAGSGGDSTPVEYLRDNFARVYDSTLWVASANDSMVGDSFYLYPYDPFCYTALQGHDSVAVYFRQANKPADFAKLNTWTLLNSINTVTTVPEYEYAVNNVFYAKPWVQFMWVTSEAKDSIAIEFDLQMMGLADPDLKR